MSDRVLDLGGIEGDVRAGALSNREIARRHGVSESYVRKLMQQNGWVKGELRQAVREEAERASMRRAVEMPEGSPDADLVRVFAGALAELEHSQRQDVQLLLSVAKKQLRRLERATEWADVMAERGQFVKGWGPVEQTMALESVVRIFARLIELQRRVHRMDDPDEAESPAMLEVRSVVQRLGARGLTTGAPDADGEV